MSGPYFVGQQVRLTGTFRNLAKALADPTNPTFKVIDGLGNETIVNGAVRETLGVWSVVITLTCAGTWRYRAESTEGLVTAGQKSFGVAADPFA